MENNLENPTVGVFVRAVGANVETVHFYQRKGLLREPDKPYGSVCRYGEVDVARVKFVKSAQWLGFSLDKITELLWLDDGIYCEEASSLVEHKLEDVHEKTADLVHMEIMPSELVCVCHARKGSASCPLIALLQGEAGLARSVMPQRALFNEMTTLSLPVLCRGQALIRRTIMENVVFIGIDLGKNSFHIRCQDYRGKAVHRKKFTRLKLIEFLATCPATTTATEACGGSHFMARKLEELGHSPELISPQFICPSVKSNKNDFANTEAIREAASHPSMRFVQSKTESQQAIRALYRVRESLVQDRVKATNQVHASLLEFDISTPRGVAVVSRLSTLFEDSSLPLYLSQLLLKLQQRYHYLVEQTKDLESQLKRKSDEDEIGQRLLSIPCVGTLTASATSTEIGDGKQYAGSRDFAAAAGLVP